MQCNAAEVADVLRLAQRDESFMREMQDNILSLVKVFGIKNYHKTQRLVPGLTSAWYYSMTSLSDLQTLGEEYTGTLRVDNNNKIPTKLIKLLWLSFHIGGGPLVDRLIVALKHKIKRSGTLTHRAQDVFLKTLDLVQQHKETLKRIHHSLFYINGKYYNISNRLAGIKYVLVRQWLKDDTFSQSFKILGHLSLFYVIFNLIFEIWTSSNVNLSEHNTNLDLACKGCVLCGENRKSASATPCGHVFCWDCIHDALKYQQNCPICREVVFPSRVMFLQNYV